MLTSIVRRLIAWLQSHFIEPPANISGANPGPKEEAAKRRMRISEEAIARASIEELHEADRLDKDLKRIYAWAQPAPGVLPKDEAKKFKLAMDSAMEDAFAFAISSATFTEGISFQGYPYLSELSQRTEYRRPVEIIAKEMTRKWIKLTATGEEDKTAKIAELDAEMKRLGVQEKFQKAVEHDGFFGRAQIYIDTGTDSSDRDELKAPLVESRTKIGKRSIRRLSLIEPIWTYPNFYNAYDPLDKNFFRPQTWFVMGKEIHASRLLTFVSREVPDMLKPSYAFGGLSLAQMLKPYVDNWLRTRQSVSDLLHAYSVFVLKTNMSDILNAGAGEQTFHRINLFNKMRDNRGLMVIDKDTEEFENVSAQIGGLFHLQAQSQEHMSAAVGIPLIVLFGIAPGGLNANSEGEIATFQDMIAAKQQSDLAPNLSRLMNLIQISLWGEIDPQIGFEWVPLKTLSDEGRANVRKIEADTDIELIDRGVIDPSESRARLAAQKESPYASLDLNKDIPVPGEDDHDDDADLDNADGAVKKPEPAEVVA
jgi:uncharacterized protein